MINISQQKLEANRLRKLGKFEEALPLYRELWAKTVTNLMVPDFFIACEI